MDFYFTRQLLRCGDMLSKQFIANFPKNVPVKKFWESVNIWQRYGQKLVSYFLGHPVYTLTFAAKYGENIVITTKCHTVLIWFRPRPTWSQFSSNANPAPSCMVMLYWSRSVSATDGSSCLLGHRTNDWRYPGRKCLFRPYSSIDLAL